MGNLPTTANLTLIFSGELSSYGPCSLNESYDSMNCSIALINDTVVLNITHLLYYGNHYHINMLLYNDYSSSIFRFNISKYKHNNGYYFCVGTHHVINASVIVSNNKTVCIECIFRKNLYSSGCYAIFHSNSSEIYKEIKKSHYQINANACFDNIPNGIYSISILDSRNYNENRISNIAIALLAPVTIIHRRSTDVINVYTSSYSNTYEIAFDTLTYNTHIYMYTTPGILC